MELGVVLLGLSEGGDHGCGGLGLGSVWVGCGSWVREVGLEVDVEGVGFGDGLAVGLAGRRFGDFGRNW